MPALSQSSYIAIVQDLFVSSVALELKIFCSNVWWFDSGAKFTCICYEQPGNNGKVFGSLGTLTFDSSVN